MWIITVYSSEKGITMYEFDSEKEAREALQDVQGFKILSEIIYLSEQSPALVAV
ncbi:hypothetical protein NDK43_24195 [Neobacillus pocheonensis]|uniref:Uncharacterized protein n=1 Tax=Neobacillus pocheonensis TaxID=363869 RepID=A0ABT0WFP4_9BACI|nr:hypothetical protein [Neobacillus pocheonensis]